MDRLKFIYFLIFISLILSSCNSTNNTIPVPTITPISDWHAISGRGLSLWLPESFEGGNPATDGEKMIARLEELGSSYKYIADYLQADDASINLLAFDTNIDAMGVTNVIAGEEKADQRLSIDAYLQTLLTNLAPQYQVIKQETISSDGYPMGLLLVEAGDGSGRVVQSIYVIKTDKSFWQLVYTTSGTFYDDKLSVFEQSARSVAFDAIQESSDSNQGSPFIMGIGFAMMIAAMIIPLFKRRKKDSEKATPE